MTVQLTRFGTLSHDNIASCDLMLEKRQMIWQEFIARSTFLDFNGSFLKPIGVLRRWFEVAKVLRFGHQFA